MIEGFVVMVVGVTVVFAFLGLLVWVMQTSAFFFTRFANRPQKESMIEKTGSNAADLTEIAVAIAAVKALVSASPATPAKADAVAHESADSVVIKAPMPGKVVQINAKVGDYISAGGVLLIIESMKMEVEIKSSGGGTVSSIAVSVGDQVSADQALASIN